jgi:hypothetical protein
MPAVVREDLAWFGAIGSALTALVGALGLLFGTGGIASQSPFFLLIHAPGVGALGTGLFVVLHLVAWPAIALGLLGCAASWYLATVPTQERWHALVTVQAAVGAVSGALGFCLLTFVVLNVLLWLAYVAIMAMMFAFVLVILLACLA